MSESLPIIIAALLMYVRCLGVVFGFASIAGIIPFSVRLGIAVGIFVSAVPYVVPIKCLGSNGELNPLLISSLGVLEFLIGMLYVSPFALALEYLPFSARLVDIIRGSMLAEQTLSEYEQRQSLIEAVVRLLLPITIFVSGGHLSWLSQFYLTLNKLGAGICDHSGLFIMRTQEIAFSYITISTKALSCGIAVAAPMIIFLFMADFLFSLLGKFTVKFNFQQEVQTFKLILGLFILILLITEEKYFMEGINKILSVELSELFNE